MAYDSTKPADHAPIVALELRNQFAGLKTLIDQCAKESELGAAFGQLAAIGQLDVQVSNPPTQAEVQSIADKVNQILSTFSGL
jgi:hypothetical protein